MEKIVIKSSSDNTKLENDLSKYCMELQQQLNQKQELLDKIYQYCETKLENNKYLYMSTNETTIKEETAKNEVYREILNLYPKREND